MLHYVRELGDSKDERFDVAAGGVRSFLITRGFREQRRSDGVLAFRRSTQIATLFAFDPSRWRVDIIVDPRRGVVKMDVFTDGQVITPRERKYFKVFFDELVVVMSPDASRSALSIWGEQALSRQAARAAVNENVGVMFGFFLSFPLLTLLLNAAVGLPMLWAIGWGFGGSLAIAYANLFSVKNRQRLSERERPDRERLPTGSA